MTMRQYACPSCGAPIYFRSVQSVFATCGYCRSTVVRRDVDIEAIGKVAQLTEDMSPLQVGTVGQIDGCGFTVCGRARMAWDDGTWNEWYLLFDDGSDGWLAEAQGFYAVNVATDLASQSLVSHKSGRSKLDLSPGQSISVSNRWLTVVDIKRAVCVGTEGELPRVTQSNSSFTSADLMGKDGGYACIELHNSQAYAFIGRYVEWDEIKAANYRQFEGWS